ncbi:hypothetical protein, conserved [Entamoeba dispar SAW760]|uniref:Deoxynucleoside kinase domain-containing protein n=1 Tax=Entamoeba dispar (strain ATCC PRA-260 / SAW760) TaxID=370354 RepID=B0ELE1_ENTDS|nr:uncharacterized protein EDI_087410 [Entamoeba dispar SAW760]EDR24663.1 hypothetical protein, conserved [Entamoeba dispar SAW760]|eukprot:EDR24663.1 hypothetical protein, conserved [Entamoeba dispar SAW760]
MHKRGMLIFTGSIGVGKTSTIDAFMKYFETESVGRIKEYIDYSPIEGKKLLNGVTNGTIRNYTLQKFIIQCYKEQLENNKNKKLLIFERHPREALKVFCEIDKTLTEKEKEEINEEISKIEKEYEIKYNEEYYFYCDVSTNYLTPEGVALAILSSLSGSDVIKFDHYVHVIFLRCDFDLQKKRIIERNRGIISEINFDYIKQVNECYESCYIKN